MKIEFVPASRDVELLVPAPEPTKKHIPNWYKNSKNFTFDKVEFDSNYEIKNKGIKSCSPFFDSMSAGYVQTTWTDIYIERKNNSVAIITSSGPEIVQTRPEVSIPIDKNFYEIEFVWKMPWLPKVPKGYSTVLCHPLNRIDLPFLSLSGIINSEKYYHNVFGNFPFYIKKDFTGLIPVGTPMYQIIPIKKEKWNSSKEKFDENTQKQRLNIIQKHFYGSYKKYFWEKQNYN
jgi:hypothetical protein